VPAADEAGQDVAVGEATVAIVAALPREIAGLVRGTRADAELVRRGIRLHRVRGAVVVAAGMGAGRVTLAVEAALRAGGEVEMLVSAGLAGACSTEVRPGEVVEATRVVDAKTGERFSAGVEGGLQRVLVTAEKIAGVAEKSRLWESYGAAMVDMEAATVARLAQTRGLRFRAIKGISDAHDFEMESMSRFADERGQFRTGAFALHMAMRPWRWGGAMRVGRDSSRALTEMWVGLRTLIEEAGS
jgi:adenosylhomocysteine nucleosidase